MIISMWAVLAAAMQKLVLVVKITRRSKGKEKTEACIVKDARPGFLLSDNSEQKAFNNSAATIRQPKFGLKCKRDGMVAGYKAWEILFLQFCDGSLQEKFSSRIVANGLQRFVKGTPANF